MEQVQFKGIDESDLEFILEDYVLQEDMMDVLMDMEKNMTAKYKADLEFTTEQKVKELRV